MNFQSKNRATLMVKSCLSLHPVKREVAGDRLAHTMISQVSSSRESKAPSLQTIQSSIV